MHMIPMLMHHFKYNSRRISVGVNCPRLSYLIAVRPVLAPLRAALYGSKTFITHVAMQDLSSSRLRPSLAIELQMECPIPDILRTVLHDTLELAI